MILNKLAIEATGKYLLVPAGGAASGGIEVQVSGTFVASMLLKNPTSAVGSTLVLGSALTVYSRATGAGSSAAITSAADVVVVDVGQDLYLDLTYTSGTVVVTVLQAAGSLLGPTGS